MGQQVVNPRRSSAIAGAPQNTFAALQLDSYIAAFLAEERQVSHRANSDRRNGWR
jgi:hypothetical protein